MPLENATRRPTRVGGVAVLALLALGALLLALRPATTVVTVDDAPQVQPPADGTAVVAVLRAPGGLAPFGIRIIDPTHTIEVRFLTGPGCAALLTPGDPWPTPHPECAAQAEVAGTVGSLGITDTGGSLVGVTFTLPGGCYERLEPGMPWPPGVPECAG